MPLIIYRGENVDFLAHSDIISQVAISTIIQIENGGLSTLPSLGLKQHEAVNVHFFSVQHPSETAPYCLRH